MWKDILKGESMSDQSMTLSMQEVTAILLRAKNIQHGHYISHIIPNVSGGVLNTGDDEKSEPRQAIVVAFDKIELKEVPDHVSLAVDASTIWDK